MRIDSALPAALLLGFAAAALRARRAPRRAWVALLAPFAVIVGAWLAWKLAYYGSVVPNTFYAKVALRPVGLRNGLLYLGRFLHWYGLWPVLVLGGAGLAWRARRQRAWPDWVARARPLGAVLLAWCLYLVAIGGDFMEFRLLVPLVPALAVVLAGLVYDGLGAAFGRPRLVAAVAALGLAAASALHAVRFTRVTPDRTLDSVPALADFYSVVRDGDWSFLGRRLHDELAGTDALLAVHAAGAIPFYSRLRCVDMYGLTDAQVARHGAPAPPTYARPGHQRHITLDELRRRGVHFVVNHPTLLRRGVLAQPAADSLNAQWVRDSISFHRAPIGFVTLVAMPLDTTSALLLWYLTPTPAIDARIEARGWEKVTLFAG
jgi:arabinofuranosyltransferase